MICGREVFSIFSILVQWSVSFSVKFLVFSFTFFVVFFRSRYCRVFILGYLVETGFLIRFRLDPQSFVLPIPGLY
jgi:hypothetical protein